jgi:uncharacterized protein (DUF169 family)
LQLQRVGDIQEYFGEAWTGVKFYFSDSDAPDSASFACRRFCEAVSKSRSRPVLLRPGDLSCPGANHVFGWDRNLEGVIAAELAEDRGMEIESARNLISEVPVLACRPVAIGLNTADVPDMIVSYCQPRTAMRFVELWQAAFDGRSLVSDLTSVLSVCGNVCVASYLSAEAALSFGCDKARESGSIGRDRLVMGIPYNLVDRLTSSDLHLMIRRLPQKDAA